ncbi:CPBP family intramembrane glutamic endopeptidase [Peptacetobacter hiranonis]|uniref:CPBP family intramembrane glutamic endopeptidase n=1 Tax=Peptacetobacter hiranonis TaxID=89152 RepID=UPI002E79DCD9|nr:CPBP family intramembrane glutamic endopeptidase [Peptacetobacter hiranonis]MEE0247750.1 CPBP family intramembrane glutamic endopeptidase [Peptacetobacter hiranonis]
MLEFTISSVKTAVANTIVFAFIPLIWWFIKHRKEVGFFEWIGLYKPQLKSKVWVLALFAVLYYFFYNFDFTKLVNPETLKEIENSSSVAANTFAGIGTMAILPALIENFVANGLAEEILYRGFLCKRFCEKLGTSKGIILQAVLFGLMHNIIYIIAGLNVGLWYHTLTFIFTGTGALLLGYLNEKIFNGSIVPSILLHGTGNFIASMLVAFA